jgi:hypothetical protein
MPRAATDSMTSKYLESPGGVQSTGPIASWLPSGLDARTAQQPDGRERDGRTLGRSRGCPSLRAVFFTAEFSSPWALNSPNPELLANIVMPEAEHMSLFHILMDGECFVDCGACTSVAMEAGDVVVFPHGHAHTMRSDDTAQTTRLDHVLSHPSPDALPQVSCGGGGRTARLTCAYLNCNQRFTPLFEALPPMLIVRRRENYAAVETVDGAARNTPRMPQDSSRWLATTLRFTVNEAVAARRPRQRRGSWHWASRRGVETNSSIGSGAVGLQ